ncbi:uncharacterized protein [Dysidea avara]|uniref:uncharacterized protein isoform X2 n=1 Tax=Dysidea avara TaxID=196820 RepID=UPI00331D719A
MSTSFTINITDDNIGECDETFTLTLSVPSSPCGVISGSVDTSEVMIRDDDGVMLLFDRSQYSIEENTTPLSVGLILNRTTSEDVIVEVSVNNGSAKAGIDYDRPGAPLVFNVTISSGMTSSFDVNIIDNFDKDGNKNFFITIRLISTCLPITIRSDTISVTIIDDEVLRVQFSSKTFLGKESSLTVNMNVVILGGVPESDNVTITFTFNSITATAFYDFMPTPLTAVIPVGATNTTVRVPVMSDNIVEGDEVFSMSLNVPSSLGPGIVAGAINRTTGIIVDTSKIRVRFAQKQYTGSEDTGFVEVTLELVGGTSSIPFDVIVTPLQRSPVSVKGGDDFNNTPQTATFGSEMRMSSVSVPVVDDMLAEGRNETFDLMLSVPSSLSPAITAAGRDTAIGVIIDTTMLKVEFGSRRFVDSESSGHVEVVVIISGGSSIIPIEVVVTPSEQSPVSARGSGVDFDSNPITIIFGVGEVSKRINISVSCDEEVEGEERFDIALLLPNNNPQVTLRKNRQTSTVRITDSTVEVNFDKSSYEVRENSNEVMIMIVLNQLSSNPFEVTISLMDGNTQSGNDYSSPRTITVSILANYTSTSFTIDIFNNNISECDETFTLTLTVSSSPCGVVSGSVNTSEVMIIDDDGVMLSFNQSQYSIEENVTPLSVSLILNRTTSEDVIVEVSVNDGSAKAGIDYDRSGAPLVFNVTISSGMTSSSFDVDIINNTIQDGNKMFFITIRLISTCLPTSMKYNTSNVTIIDDEVLKVEFSRLTFNGSETSKHVLVGLVIRGGTIKRRIKIQIYLSGVTAQESDVDLSRLTATIPAGATTTTVRVPVMSDNIVEGDEIFSMNLTVSKNLSPKIIAGSVTTATGIILDSSDIIVRFTQTQYTGSEDTGFVLVTLELVGGTSSRPFNVTVTPLAQPPMSASLSDYNSIVFNATFSAGDNATSFKIPVYRDDMVEYNEMFDIVLSLPPFLKLHIEVGDNSSAEGIIIDSTVIASITEHPDNFTDVYENDDITLSCNATASGPITYQWGRSSRRMISSKAIGVYTPALTIPSVTQDDEDEYYCTASYGVYVNGTSHVAESERAAVVVFGPPKISDPFHSAYYHIIGQQFMLECSATNDNDSPNDITFVWFKDDKLIDSASSMELQISMPDHRLFIEYLDPRKHNGNYSCGAYNNEITDSEFTNTTVIVEISKTFKDSSVLSDKRNSINGSLFTSNVELPSLDTLRDSYGPIGHLFVVVTTDNSTEPSQIPDSDLVDFNDPLRDTMYIAMVLHNMSGDQWEKMIVLGAGNVTMSVDGSSYHNAPLDREKTYFTFVRAYAYDHNDSNPRYASSGYSQPIALPVSSSGGGGSSGGGAAIIGVVVVLIIIMIAIIIVIIALLWYRKKYNKKDPALAAVTNPITKEHIPLKEKSSVMLGPTETKSLPVVNIKEQEVKTSVGQPTTLYIEAHGNPPPEISWTKNGLPVNDSLLLQNGSLYIHSTTHSDQGTYTVTATGDEGSTSEAIKLLVLNPQHVPSNTYKPIKVENFAEHIAMLHSSMNQQFTTDYSSLVMENDFSFHTCKLVVNMMKNRYKNILPYDHSRVVLNLQDKLAGTDYINASFIDGYNERKAYIACQGPMASTMAEFWRMIWEQNVTAIVMVTNIVEEGKPKCQQYWPDAVNGSCSYGNISVTLQQEEVLAEYSIRTLAVKMIEASSEAKSVNLEVQHFHFTVWPDHGVPKYPTALLSFQKRVNKHHKRKRGSPLVVHCSAGVGRTGTFITIDTELQRIKHEGIVDVYNTVHKLRFRRNFTVQTLAQYVFIFDALMESIMCGDNSIAAPAKSAKLRLEELAKVNPATKLSGYESQFRKLQASSPNESDFQYISANLPENRHKNRSMKRLPPDNSRVFINTSGYNSDYICASYIDGYRHHKAFLAAEGPMNSTMIDFWTMVWERRSHAIVMLNLLEENGKEVSAKYWPDKGETMKIGHFVIETTTESKADKYFVRRIMQVTHAKESTPRTINHFQYLCWPDHSCPSEASSIMDMVEMVETVQRRSKNGPITVHCSDGLGRTGSFCALMLCHDRFKTEHMADVFYAIKTMRTQRPGMVENTAQYEFIHKTLKETMDRLDTYSNFDNQI